MRVLITVASYYPLVDGVQAVTQYQAEGLAKLGHSVTVITSDIKGRFEKEEFHNGVRILRVHAYNKNMFHYGDKVCFLRKVKECAQNVDVMVNVCLQSFAADWVLEILSEVSCKRVLMMHGMHDFAWCGYNVSSVSEFTKKILRNIRWRVFYIANWKRIQLYDTVMHLHERDTAYYYFEKHGYKKNAVLYNAAEDVFFDDIPEKTARIINVGSYSSRKNQMLALESFYKANLPDYELVLIGNRDNKYYKTLRQKKIELDRQYGVRNVYIYCKLSRPQTVELIKGSRIYLLTSTWEAFPISIIEAMASGCTFVSTDVGIVKYLPGGVTCTKQDELSGYIEDAAATWRDRAQMARGYAKKHFRIEKQVDELERILNNAVVDE